VAPPSSSASKPGRLLAALVGIIVLLLVAVVGGNIASPGKWSKDFHILLGLDLTSGTEVALQAQTPHGKTPSAAEMSEAVTIMLNRVDAGGFTEASVVPQGTNIIDVSVPGANSQQVVKLVEQTAKLLFRQVLLIAPNTASVVPTPTPTPSPASTASGSPSPSPSGSASATPKAKSSASASPKASTKAFVRGAARGGVAEMARDARSLGGDVAKPSPSPSAGVTPSGSPTPSASATPSPSAAATTPAAAANGTSSWEMASGDPTKVSAQVKAEFNKLNCADKNWQQEIHYNPQIWDEANRQIVSCGNISNTPGQYEAGKFVLDAAKVLGSEVKSASASTQQGTVFFQVNLNFNGAGTAAFGSLTQQMFNSYGKSGSPLDDLAVVLDGKVISFPAINQGAILGGSAQITGNFDQTSATSLANVLSYGALPLSFHQQSEQAVSPQLGHDQLQAGLVAAGLGLILVVVYLLFYYRGLAIVSVASLVIAALLAYLSVVALGKYQHLALSLAGIAGLIVAIGITADSFVVFFERLRDEVREGGKTLRTAVEHGWVRARRTILVSDTVSFLAAALLYYFSIGDVRGFAFTLGLTTVIDVVVVFLFTKPMMTLLARTKFFGGGHPLSGLDPVRLGSRAPWRGGPRAPARSVGAARSATAKEA
jgi:preprotein translocase subunit SecD